MEAFDLSQLVVGFSIAVPSMPAVSRTTVGRTAEKFLSGEAPGLLDPMFPDDGQTKDRYTAGQDQPMGEFQGVAVERGNGQRDLVVARHEVGHELKRARHLVDRSEEPTEVSEDEHEPGDDGERGLGRHQEADEDSEDGKRE